MSTRLNIPPLTRGLILGLLTFTLLNAGARYRKWAPTQSERIDSRVFYVPYLTIIPGQSVIYPWVFLTATLAEQNVLGLLVTGATLFYGGRYLERAWSSREYSKFMIIISLIPNIVTFFLYFTCFVLSRNEGFATTAISGGIAIQAAFLVSFKQLVPEHTVTLFRGLISMRVKHFPAIFLLANTISGILLGTDTAMLLAWVGFLTSWTYLRFYRISPSLFSSSTGVEIGTGGPAGSGASDALMKGDASDTFSFAAFWPDVVQPPISILADNIYNILVSLRLCTPFSAEEVEEGNEQATAREGGNALPSLLNPGKGGSARGEAERRRALALRALDQRLQGRGPQPQARPQQPVVATKEAASQEEDAPAVGDADQSAPGGAEDGDVKA